ncbi:Sua5/YciO/YrdC/YwlC family protein [Bernardetia litoralis DSM 6794]|uniref:Sua5/YciO/YrdC/YwlC family protein n=1 Tax=Bernardetia litoralis (strain ATCC 23117 / DSM 6794 / NBRC 15988 / NCIMB 1366 / Fx l1 / Sio-4) TaxID=880071 RepID=I4ALE6_BERLS|nr:L-threonylcarbamoyladenylate synthase [Bernardetia litoralis]AFM04781.1 Sua5/YciO/YrdC/YwlC family protein [Bernardetia litoralis DSM 6794]
MAELLKIHPDNPQESKIQKVVEVLRNGGVIIYPTDTVYGIGCDFTNAKAVEKVCKIKGIDPKKMHLSFICYDLSDISLYAHRVSNHVFKVMKKALPGAFTFILDSSNKVPKVGGVKKKQVGIRVPDHKIPRMIVQELGNPIVTTSVYGKDGKTMTDPSLMKEEYEHQVDLIIDAGMGDIQASTVIRCIEDNIILLRQGLGDIEKFADVLSKEEAESLLVEEE